MAQLQNVVSLDPCYRVAARVTLRCFSTPAPTWAGGTGRAASPCRRNGLLSVCPQPTTCLFSGQLFSGLDQAVDFGQGCDFSETLGDGRGGHPLKSYQGKHPSYTFEENLDLWDSLGQQECLLDLNPVKRAGSHPGTCARAKAHAPFQSSS